MVWLENVKHVLATPSIFEQSKTMYIETINAHLQLGSVFHIEVLGSLFNLFQLGTVCLRVPLFIAMPSLETILLL